MNVECWAATACLVLLSYSFFFEMQWLKDLFEPAVVWSVSRVSFSSFRWKKLGLWSEEIRWSAVCCKLLSCRGCHLFTVIWGICVHQAMVQPCVALPAALSSRSELRPWFSPVLPSRLLEAHVQSCADQLQNEPARPVLPPVAGGEEVQVKAKACPRC